MAHKNYGEYLPFMVGAFLKKELKRRRITQEAFAEMMGVTDRTVGRWVNGEINSLSQLSEACAVLGISARDIFGDTEDVPCFKLKEERNCLWMVWTDQSFHCLAV